MPSGSGRIADASCEGGREDVCAMTGQANVVRVRRMVQGSVSPGDFEIAQKPLAALDAGQVLVRNLFVSVDPYMRLPLTGRAGVKAPIGIGSEMSGGAVGVVEQSRAPGLAEGDTVLSQSGWCDRFVAQAATMQKVDVNGIEPSWYLGILGLTGITAYAGIEEVLQPQSSETILVSSAAGAVGVLAVQLAKLRGARVLGSAGSDDKCRWLVETLGVDAAVNYRTQDLGAFLAKECPKGLDCYFDNVGGQTLDAALRAMRMRGRIGLCGAMSQYNDPNYRAGPSEFFTIIEKCLTVTGFNAGMWGAKAAAFMPTLVAHLKSGAIKWPEVAFDGLASVPDAFTSLFDGRSTGKVIVRL